jgi:hypothetical protein
MIANNILSENIQNVLKSGDKKWDL